LRAGLKAEAALTQDQIEVLVQTTYGTVDAVLLALMSGSAAADPIEFLYASLPTNSPSWQGAAIGQSSSSVTFNPMYLGLDQSPSGDVWVTSGTLGAASLSGGGSASFSYSPGAFAMTFSDSLSVGAASASASFTISGTELGSDASMLGSSIDPNADLGFFTLNGSSIPNDIALSLSYSNGVILGGVNVDGVTASQFFGAYGPDAMMLISTPPPLVVSSAIFQALTVYAGLTTVPETSTWLMLLTGFAVAATCGAAGRQHRGRQAHEFSRSG
jgi:hypothetical protein